MFVFIENPDYIEKFDNEILKSVNSRIFSFNIQVHQKLTEKNIKHEIAENFLNEIDKWNIYDKTISLYDWYRKKKELSEFEFQGINIFSVLDAAELHMILIREIILFQNVKKILEKERTDQILTTKHMATLIKNLAKFFKIKITTVEGDHNINTHWGKIAIRYDIGKIPINIIVSREKYITIKNILESLIGNFSNLWFNHEQKKPTILFLEFNPAQYKELIYFTSNCNKNLLFLNRRRPTIWNFKSLKILRDYNCKIITPNSYLTRNEKQKALRYSASFAKKLTELWTNDQYFEDVFSIDEYSFWPGIKDTLYQIFMKRMREYVELILFSKKLFQYVDLSCIVYLYSLGETERSILESNDKKIPSILLEHGATNYLPEISKLDIHHRMFKDKVSLWGQIQKDYFKEYRNIPEDKIIMTGSPRHDSFFKKSTTYSKHKQKTVLITLGNFDEYNGQADTNSYLRFESLMNKLLKVLSKFPELNLIIKLHPAQDPSIDFIKQIIRRLSPNVIIYQSTSILDIIALCDIMININTEFFPSTVILEGLIMNKPIMNIVIMDKLYEFEYVKDRAVFSVQDNDDLEGHLRKILFDTNFQNELIKNGQKHLKRYLSNHGTASKSFAEVLCSF